MVPSILQRSLCLSLWWDFFYIVCFQVVFSFSWGILFSFFSHFHLFDYAYFQYPQWFLDCASSYSSRAITFTFGQIPLGRVWTPLSSQLDCASSYEPPYPRSWTARVRIPVALLRSLLGKYPWEGYEPPYPRSWTARVRIPVALLRSLSGKYPWEGYEPPYPRSYGLNSTTTVLLGE